MLVGATTENPAFAVIAPLLSRCRVVQLVALSHEHVNDLLQRALKDSTRGLGERKLRLGAEGMERLVHLAGGDARRALTILEAVASAVEDGAEITIEVVMEAAQHHTLIHDKSG
ncbi:MAG: replication-associated recombination protein A, partial [Nitrospinota bacterium]|nr:replication-associated recombination protein A [Nitrospinota bacterium]